MTITTRLLTTIFVTVVAITATGRAQEAAQRPLWRYVDAQTLAVARLDLTAFDRPAIEQWLTTLLKANSDAQTVEAVTAALRDGPFLAIPEKLKQAGVKEIFAVFTLSDIPNSPGHILIVLPPGADRESITRVAGFPAADPANPRLRRAGPFFAMTVNDTLLVSAGDPARFENFPAAERPELARAFAAAGPAALAIGYAPNDDMRRVVEQMLPQLPPPAGVPSTVLTRGVRFAHVAVSLPPKPSLNVQVQSDNVEAAQKLHALVTHLLAVARNDLGFRHNVPAADQIIDAVTPRLDNGRLTLSLDTPAVDKVAALLATGLAKARQQALGVQSMYNLRQIGMGIMLYATENKGAYPDTLGQIASYLKGEAGLKQMLTNPAQPTRQPAYAYVKPKGLMKDTGPGTLLAHETFDQWPGRVAVLFADGHVEMVGDQAHFDQLLQKAQNPGQ